MATYYVKKIDGTIYYKSAAIPTAADSSVGDLEAFDELAAVHDADTAYICKGAFTGTELDADSSLSLTKKYAYFGPLLPSDPNYATDGGEVYLNANGATLSGSGVLRTDTAAVTPGACVVGAFKIGNTVYSTGSTYAVYNNANGWQFDGVQTYHTERGFYIVHTDVVLNKVAIEEASVVGIYSTKTYTWNYGKIHNATMGINCNGVSPTLNNVNINGISTEAIFNQNTGTVTCNNCIVLNSCLDSATKYPITNSSTGVITFNNGLVLPNTKDQSRISTGGTVNLSNVSYAMPLFRQSRRPAVAVFGVDDLGSLGYFNDVVAPALSVYGWKGTLAISAPGDATESNWTTINVLYAAGHDFTVHGDTFENKMTDLTGLRIQYVGAGSAATMTIADNTLTTSCTGDTDSNLNIDLTNASYDTLNELVAYINGLAGYTCTRLNTDTSVKINTAYLADITGEDIRTGTYDAALDADKVYDGEMTATKASIEANIPGYTADIFVAPGNASDASMRTGMRARGIVFARGDGTSSSGLMEELTVHNVTPKSLYVFFGNDANPQNTAGKIEQYMGAYLEYLAWAGGIAWFYAHDTDEFTADAWAAVLAVVKKHGGITVLPAKQAYSYIVANGSTADSGVTYTRTWTDASDYRLRAGSPAINAGTDVGLTTDFLGKPTKNPPSIGAYEYFASKTRHSKFASQYNYFYRRNR